MNLYIWNDPYHVKYGGSFLFVLAESVEQARELAAAKAHRNAYGLGRDEKATPLPNLGPPQRVIDSPTAEIYEWSE